MFDCLGIIPVVTMLSPIVGIAFIVCGALGFGISWTTLGQTMEVGGNVLISTGVIMLLMPFYIIYHNVRATK